VDGGSSQQQVAAPKNPLMATIAESNIVCRSLPHSPSSPLLTTTRSETVTTTSEELTIENSLIGSRVPLIPRSISGTYLPMDSVAFYCVLAPPSPIKYRYRTHVQYRQKYRTTLQVFFSLNHMLDKACTLSVPDFECLIFRYEKRTILKSRGLSVSYKVQASSCLYSPNARKACFFGQKTYN
jgi:hypothetical protein